MNSKTNNVAPSSDDLQFIPLNIKEPFKSEDSSWAPYINIDVETENMTNNFFIGLPNLKTKQGFTTLPSINANPILPYPSDNSNTSSDDISENIQPNMKNIIEENEFYPSESLNNELYSYNDDTKNETIDMSMNRFSSNLPHLDILRDFDLSMDYDIPTNTRACCQNDEVDKIFKSIEENNSGLLNTLKSYRIPYPISTLIIKKIIKLTLSYSKKE